MCCLDLNVGNILLQRPFHGLPVEEISNQYDTPVKIDLHRADGALIGPEAPSYVVVAMCTFLPSHELTDCQVKISDFGSAFIVGHEPKNNENTTVTTIVASPEFVFGEKLTLPIDIWSLGCTLYQIVSSQPLFFLLGGQDEHIENMVKLLGPLPGPLWERWAERENYFTKDRNRIVSSNFENQDLEYLILHLRDLETSETFQITKAETATLKALLSVMLVYTPSGRISLDGVLISDYMKNWGKPALVESLGKDVSKL